jgi:hypothetical protein
MRSRSGLTRAVLLTWLRRTHLYLGLWGLLSWTQLNAIRVAACATALGAAVLAVFLV